MRIERKDQMSKRERVIATINHEETDRTPVFDLIMNDAVIEYFTGQYPPAGAKGQLLKCKATALMLDMTRAVEAGPREPGYRQDEDGFIFGMDRWLESGLFKRPFHDETGAVEWLKKATERLNSDYDLKREVESHKNQYSDIAADVGDDTVILLRQSGTGLDNVRYLLGLELFSYIAIDEPELISEYIERSTEREVKLIHAIADAKLSPVVLTYGDIAYKNGLLHSPAWLEQEFFPRLKRLNDAWHEHGLKCLFHSDGNVMQVLPQLIETGIDGLNPIETIAGMDLAELKALYGDKLFLAGGIDMSQLLAFGSPEEVYEISKQSIKVAGAGYFIGSTTELDNTSRLENILAMLRAAWGNCI